MLSIFLVWSYIAVLCLVYGCGAAALLRLLDHETGYDRLPLPSVIIAGLCLITAFTGYLSLFIKIGLTANIIIVAGGVLITAVEYRGIVSLVTHGWQNLFQLNKCVLLLSLLSFFYILSKSTTTPSLFDTGLYHAQAIHWIEEYAVVPGLGNLHHRLAFNSAWFLPNALFGLAFLKIQPFHAVNGFLLALVVFLSLAGLDNLVKEQYKFSNILRACMAIPAISVFKDGLSSPTPDIPAALLICLVFIYYLQSGEEDGDLPPLFLSFLIVTPAAMAVTVKLSALPLGFLAAAVIFRELSGRRWANSLVLAGAGLFLFIPFILRNIWLSGYPVFPYPGVDPFACDWKIPETKVHTAAQFVKDFARGPRGTAALLRANGAFSWVPAWFHHTVADYGNKLARVLLPGALLFLACVVNMIRTKSCRIGLREIGRQKAVYFTLCAGLLFWFFSAPDPRFGLGFMIVAVVLIFLPFLQPYGFRAGKWLPWAIGLFFLYYLLIFGVSDIRTLGDRLLLPAPYPRESIECKEIQGKKVYIPRGTQLGWYEPFPCAGYPGCCAFRGRTFQEGFRAK